MTSVSITQHKDGRTYVEVDGKRLERVLSLTLELHGGWMRPVIEIIQHDKAGAESTRIFSPKQLVLRTV